MFSLNSNTGLNSIPMFNGSNILEFTTAFKAYSHFAGLWPYVSGKKVAPAILVDEDDEKYDEQYAKLEAWIEEDEKAVRAILLKLPHEQHHFAKKCRGKR